MYRFFLKRLIDIIVAIIFLVFFLPLLIIVTILLLFYNQGKPFFLQKRPGKNEVIFKVMKFRTMNNKRDSEGNLLPDSERLTRLGSFLRKTSLDEAPQVFNILKGDMSIIGPRPLLPEYLSLYNERQRKRHNVRPGATGWAQVNGRNQISWEQKFDYDVWYVENYNFLLDLKIFFKTIMKIYKKEGINSANMATTKKFQGNG